MALIGLCILNRKDRKEKYVNSFTGRAIGFFIGWKAPRIWDEIQRMFWQKR